MRQTGEYLRREIRRTYPEGETTSMIRLIMEHMGYDPRLPVSDPELRPGPSAVAQINEIVSEIHTNKPIQYILGYTFFHELKILLNEHVLIPRPETEELVYRIISETASLPLRMLDVGTGSGCIALALKHRFPEADVFGMDVSGEALKTARLNAAHHLLEVHWLQADIGGELPEEVRTDFDLIISNPPYVLESQRAAMDDNVLRFEPDRALFADRDHPLELYEKIGEFAARHLRPGGTLWVEINEQLGEETAKTIERSGLGEVTILRDIHEKERFIKATR